MIITNWITRKSALKSHHKYEIPTKHSDCVTVTQQTQSYQQHHIYMYVYTPVRPRGSTTINASVSAKKTVSFSKFQLPVSDSPPPALTSVRSGNTAQPQTGLPDLLFKGHLLPVQGLQREGFPWDLSDRWDPSGGFWLDIVSHPQVERCSHCMRLYSSTKYFWISERKNPLVPECCCLFSLQMNLF